MEEPIPERTIKRRKRLSFEYRTQIKIKIRGYLGLGFTIQEMIDALIADKDINHRFGMGFISELISEIRHEAVSTQEATRILAERIEKRKLLERQVLSAYKQALNKGDIRNTLQALRLVKEVEKDTDDFLSRLGLMPAIPVREEVEITPKIPVQELILALQRDELKEAIKGMEVKK